MCKVQQLIRTGEIGKVVAVQADFGWSTDNSGPEDRIWNRNSGGMTLDIRMYMAQVGQVAYPGEELERIQSMGTKKITQSSPLFNIRVEECCNSMSREKPIQKNE